MPLRFPMRWLAGGPADRRRLGGLALLVALLGVVVSPAAATAAPLVGTDQVQSNVDSSAAGSARAFRYTAPTTGSLDELNVYVDGSSVPSSLTVGLYANSSSRPNGRVTMCTISAPRAGWNACKAPSAGVVAGTQYWLAVLSPAGAGKLAFRDRPRDGSASYSSSSLSMTSLPTTFPVGSKRNGYSPASIFGAKAATAPIDGTPPSTPSGLAKTSATASSVSLSWGASSDASGVAGYRVYRDGLLAGAGSATSAVVAGLACGTSYVFAVEAYDTVGNTSPRGSLTTSTAACQPVPDTQAPSAPQGLGWTTTTQNSIGVKWNTSTDNTGVAGYRVYRNGAAVGTTQSLSYTVGGLQCGTSYTIAVEAFDAAGNASNRAGATGTTSTSACAAPSPTPTPTPSPTPSPTPYPTPSATPASSDCTPKGVKASASGTTVTVDWDDLSNCSAWKYFAVRYSNDPNADKATWTRLSGDFTTSTATHANVAPGPYYYYVTSADTSRNPLGDRSAVASATVQAPPPPPQGSCAVAKPNVPDGPDPWGGCFPGPSNTGVPNGVNLTTYTGPCRITTPNTVIDSKTVNCSLDIATSGVVIRNSRVNGSIDVFDDTDSVTVIDSNLDAGPVNGTTNSGARAIMDRHFDLIRVEAIRGVSGGWCNDDCIIQDSYFHGQDPDEGGAAHMSGFRQGGGALPRSQQFLHNSIACDAPVVPPDAGCSADITGYGDFETVQNNYLYRNLLVESPHGAFCAYGGSSGSSNGAKPFPFGNNNVWRDNIFQHGQTGRCAAYNPPLTDLDPGVRGNVSDNNRWDTGELLPVPD